MSDTLLKLYQGATDERDFFQKYRTQIDDPHEYEAELRELMMNDAKPDGRHLFHLSYKNIDGTDRLFIIDESGNESLSVIQWTPLKLLQLIILTQDLPTIKYLLADGVFDDENTLLDNKRMLIYTMNLDIIKAFEFKYGSEVFDNADYSILYPLTCMLLYRVFNHPEYLKYHCEKINMYIRILNLRYDLCIDDVMSKDDVLIKLKQLLGTETYSAMSKYKEHYNSNVMNFDRWRDYIKDHL